MSDDPLFLQASTAQRSMPWRLTKSGVLLTFILVIVSCSTVEVGYDFDPGQDFSELRSFDWMQAPPDAPRDPRIEGNTLFQKQVHEAVTRALEAKGFNRLTSGTPDFLVGYHASVDRRSSVQVLNNQYGYAPGWGWGYGAGYAPYAYPSTYVYEYDEGTLIVDIVDASTRELVWRGSATDEVDFSASPEKRNAQLNDAVNKVLSNFPPPK